MGTIVHNHGDDGTQIVMYHNNTVTMNFFSTNSHNLLQDAKSIFALPSLYCQKGTHTRALQAKAGRSDAVLLGNWARGTLPNPFVVLLAEHFGHKKLRICS